MEIYNVHRALKILKQYYITDSIQMVTRWIREGKIKGERSPNKKEGYRIYHDDLFEFIEEERPGLPEIMAVYESFINSNEQTIEKFVSEDELFVDEFEEPNEVEHENVIGNTRIMEYIKELESQIQHLQHSFIQNQNTLVTLLSENNRLTNYKESFNEKEDHSMNESNLHNGNLVGNQDKENRSSQSEHEKLSYTEFTLIANKLLENESFNVSEHDIESKLRSIYEYLVDRDTEILKSSVKSGDKGYKCPFSGKVYMYLKPMIKGAIKNQLSI